MVQLHQLCSLLNLGNTFSGNNTIDYEVKASTFNVHNTSTTHLVSPTTKYLYGGTPSTLRALLLPFLLFFFGGSLPREHL